MYNTYMYIDGYIIYTQCVNVREWRAKDRKCEVVNGTTEKWQERRKYYMSYINKFFLNFFLLRVGLLIGLVVESHWNCNGNIRLIR